MAFENCKLFRISRGIRVNPAVIRDSIRAAICDKKTRGRIPGSSIAMKNKKSLCFFLRVFLFELVNTAGCIYQHLLTGKERMRCI